MNIFITGGTSGIGKELAKLYLSEGHRVGICGGDDAFFKKNWESPPENLYFFDLDVREREKHISTLEEFSQGELDLIVVCAGINQQGSNFAELDFDIAHRIFDINLMGALNSIESAFRIMKPQKRGQIAVLSSASAVAGFPGAAAYTSSKAAIMTMMEALSIDYKAFGIYCSCICPGYVDTPMARGANRSQLPLVIGVEEAALKIKMAIQKRKELYFFPFTVNIFMNIIRLLPRRVFRFLQWHLNRKKNLP